MSESESRLLAGASSSSRSKQRRAYDEDAVLEALRAGNEEIFSELVEQWSSTMLRLAHSHVADAAVAEEVVQEAWLILLRDLDRFERRSSLRTWVLGIVVNLARSRARAERRSLPLPADESGAVVDPARFRPPDAARWPDHWARAPVPWGRPEERLLAAEVREVILEAVARLPTAQREVLVLRDLEGVGAAEACNALGLSDANQRVLLHRGRSRVRDALEQYFEATERT